MAIEDVIAEQSVTIANQMLQIAEYAKTEREVELHSFTQIKAFCAKAGVKIAGEFDRTIGSGRPDAHYQGLIIEYKDPSNPATRIGPGPESAGTKAVVKQIKERFPELERELHYPLKRLMGVGCDGRMLVFVRYRDGRWDVDPPQPVTPHSVERLLRALISLGAQGKSFIPEYLAADFGSASEIAQKGVRDLYTTITTTKSKKTLTFFSQWKILFGEVCGYDVEGKNTKIQKLGEHYGIPDAQPAELLFAIHTYYAIFMKFLAAEIAGSFSPLGLSTLKACVGAPSSAALRREMESLEQGGIWSQLKITNFLEGDLFSWYLDAWDDRVSGAVHGIVRQLDEYDPTTLSVDPAESRDLLKKLYQQLFPKSVRHDLGEYYTPDWLAEHVLNELEYHGNPDKRILDPGCGSGTFLVVAINRIKAWFDEHRHECGYGEAELVRKILGNVIGFDLNPLAVMASRTNYLMALRDLLKHVASVEIPVYLCDSIMTPTEYGDLFTGKLGVARKLKTSAAEFLIPAEIATSRERIGKYAETLEFCVRRRYSPEDFLTQCAEQGLPTEHAELHNQLFSELARLDADNQNGLWARIIKNAFAPLFIGQVDFVAGNPPWIYWNSLPAAYRQDIRRLWLEYGFLTQKGIRAVLPAGMLDMAALFTYVCADVYLSDHGSLGFLLTQSLLKSKGGGEGFRRLKLLKSAVPLSLKHVDDMSELKVFEAANKTACVILEKGRPTRFPVPYVRWTAPSGSGTIDTGSSHADVLKTVNREDLEARPVDQANPLSPLITLSSRRLFGIMGKAGGKSDYGARSGVHTHGANGIFRVEVVKELGSNFLIRNLTESEKIPTPHVDAVIEGTAVYPLVRGKDIDKWRVEVKTGIIVTHPKDRARDPYTEGEFKKLFQRTYSYLYGFRDRLSGRSMMTSADAFFRLFKIGPYTMSEWKVLWKRVANTLAAVAVGPRRERPWAGKPVVPIETVTMVACSSAEEAYYLAGMLNSVVAEVFVGSYSSKNTGSFGSVHVLQHVGVPRFDPRNGPAATLAKLSEQCHLAAAKGDREDLQLLQAEVDKLAAAVWGITEEELKAVKAESR